MAEISAGQATQVARLIEQALHVQGAKQDQAITEMREGAVAIINLKIKEAEDMRATLEKQMADTTEGCQKLLEKVIDGEGRTSTDVEHLNTMNTKIDGVIQIMADWSITVEQNLGHLTETKSDWSMKVDHHQLQMKAEADAFKVEQSQKEQNMEERLNQSFNLVTTASSSAVTQVRGEMEQ